MGDLLALMGDATDGISGVPKVGQKTAAQLINGNLERVISNSDKVAGQVGMNLGPPVRSLHQQQTLVPLGVFLQPRQIGDGGRNIGQTGGGGLF